MTTIPAMPFTNNRFSKYRFERESVMLNAPESSGIYGLFNAFWVYVGEADNIRASLLEHLGGDNPCILHYAPSSFAFVLIPWAERACRHEELVTKIKPLCKGKAFAYRAGS
jgi:hypothetical protein